MAHHLEPMDIDSDFDNKENSLHHNNVLPFTEKGYEELDVSELNMKLRYSVTPASSPMSKSYTANCLDNRSLEAGDDSFNVTVHENSNLTRSLNATLTINDNVVKSLKALPLQALPTEQFVDSNRNTSVLRPLDSTVTQDNANITVTVSGPSDIDESLSLLSSSSSTVQTPEALTPTKDISKNDGGSPIMRGLKSVLNMFRSSQSPIPPTDSEDNIKPEILSPTEASLTIDEAKSQAILASTPISTHRKKETSPTKRNSPYKDSIVFNDDLEKELQWKDETTIIFSQERIPIHKLYFQQPQIEKKSTNNEVELPEQDIQDDMNSTVEYMDISYNESIRDRTMTDIQIMGNKSDCTITGESDGEFVDCETTFTKNESLIEDTDKTPVNDKTLDLDLTKYIENTNENTSASRLKQIILDTTQDILDATLSITPEDLLPEALEKTKDISSKALLPERTEVIIPSEIQLEKVIESMHTMISGVNQENSVTSQENLPVLTQTVDVVSPSVEIQKEEDPNVTRTIENDIQPVLDPTIEITSSLANAEYNEDSNATNTIGNIPADTIISQNQPVVENDSTSNSETIVLDIEDQVGTLSIYNNAAYMISDTALDIEFDKTGLDASHIIEYDSSNSDVASSCPGTVDVITTEDVINKPSPILNDEVEPSPVKEISVTELAADIPLPDEDDLEKELSVHVDISTDASIAPNSLPLDLVDDIKLASEICEIKHNVPLEETEVQMEDNENVDKIILEEVLPSPNTQNVEGSDNIQNETMFKLKAVQQVIELKNEQLLLTEEPQLATIDVLPETASSSNIVDSKIEIDIEQVLDDVKIMNRIETESLNSTVTNNTEESVAQNPEVVNESVIELKPLPDIINQTITNQPNIENCELSTNIYEPVILEQQASLSENVLNKIPNHEIVPEPINKPENLSDANDSQIVEPADEITNVTQEILTITPAVEEIIKDPVTNVSETSTTKDAPVLTQTITDAQPNNVDVITTDTIILENEKQLLDTHNIPASESADIKTVDEEIILSENNSPFVSVIAENLHEINPEENFAIHSVDDQLATARTVVYTPPASPPIASKGYNFNFDEMDDPFATKTKIRISPPLDTPTKAVEPKASSKCVEKPIPKREMNNRRKTQSERKRPVAPKRKFNSTFSGAVSEKTAEKPVEPFAIGDINLDSPSNVALDPSNVMIEEDKLIHEARIVHEQTLKVTKAVLESKLESNLEVNIEHVETPSIRPVESATILTKDEKTTSSSEHSLYHSVGTSSSESIPTKNVFNLPEIDDINFNPFATKSKMRQSPTPTINIENPFATKCKIRISPESSMIVPQNDDTVTVQDITITVLCDNKMETELMEKDASENLNITTASSKASDEKNATIREVNTEDEDTIEGPFLEAEDLNTDDKMLDYDGENIDMMQFTDLPTQGNEENLDNGELFIDAEAFEFLLNQNKSNTVVDSGKESLFLKFDPLFAKRISSVTSDGVLASLSKMQKRQSTPTKVSKSPQKEVVSPVAGPSNLNITEDMDLNMSEELNDELNVTVSKPMMVVPPAVNSVTPRNKSLTPNRPNRRSITFTSPAMAVIDRLLSLSGNSSLVHDTTVSQVTREQNEADFALIQLRELLAEKEVHVYNLRSESNEIRDRLITLESHMKSLEVESQQRLKNITDLNDRLSEKTKINKSMAAVVEEYERTIASLISETAQDKKRHAEERIKLINERDEQTAHLASMEVSFTDLHSKYEKSKQVILHYKANEDNYKKSIKEFEENLTKMQNNYELLKQHATSKLNNANQELEKMNRTHEAEVLKLNAMVKRKDLHITSLEESLAQKTKANEELTAICDELINKVG